MRLSDAVGSPAEFLMRALSAAQRAHCVIYLDDVLRPAAAQSERSTTPRWPAPHWLAFADLQPQANWMHDCCYLVIDQASSSISVVPADRPPQFGAMPPGWQAVWHSADVEPWQIMPVIETPETR